MENRRKLIIIGILGAIILISAVLVYNAIRKSPAMSRRTVLKAEFRKISSLRIGTAVIMNGLEIGKVDHIYLKKDQSKMIVVDFSINPGVRIPITSEAISYVPSPLEQAYLMIRIDTTRNYNPQTEEDWLGEGDVIPGFIGSYLLDARNMVDPYIRSFDTLVLQAFPGKDSIRQIIHDVEASILRVENSSTALRIGMRENKPSVLKLMEQIETIAGQINHSEDSINIMIVNLAKTTAKLKEQDISKKIPKINPDDFKTPDFKAIENQIAKIKNRLENINNGKDTAMARLFYDKELKTNVMTQLSKIEDLIANIKAHPERYVSMKQPKTK